MECMFHCPLKESPPPESRSLRLAELGTLLTDHRPTSRVMSNRCPEPELRELLVELSMTSKLKQSELDLKISFAAYSAGLTRQKLITSCPSTAVRKEPTWTSPKTGEVGETASTTT